MSDLKLDPTLLSGATVQKVGTMPAEVTRQASQYLLLQCTDSLGNPFRLMIPFATVSRPCPSDKLMMDDLIGGTKFFTLEQIRERRNDKALGLPKKSPRSVDDEPEPTSNDPSASSQ